MQLRRLLYVGETGKESRHEKTDTNTTYNTNNKSHSSLCKHVIESKPKLEPQWNNVGDNVPRTLSKS